jgi:hypothetical protein
MGTKRAFTKQRRFTLDEQIYRMCSAWPSFRLVQKRRQVEAILIGTIQPTPLSTNYSVSVRIRPAWPPDVRVLEPELEPREGMTSLPHMYSDGCLCLHLHGDWHPGMFVAESTLPWASLWLYFYEVWLATGLWLGGGTHPGKPEHKSA